MKKWKIATILGTVCLVLTVAVCIQMKTVEKMTEDVGSTFRENGELKDEYLKWKSTYDSAYSELEKAETKLEKVRNQAISNNKEDTQIETEIKENNRLLGLTEVTGSGITIVIDDNREVKNQEVTDLNGYLIHEEDILNIVNELFNAGADAVSINGQRIVSTTSIACDGNIVRINNEKTGVPLTIRAIGYTERLYYALARPGGWLNVMEDDGVKVLIQKEDNITVPKYNGVYNYEYIL